jgi:hypothetical protein
MRDDQVMFCIDGDLNIIADHARTAPASSHRAPSMSVDLMLPAAEKITLVLEAIGDDKIRVNSSSLGHPLTILPDQAIEIVGIEKKVMVRRVARSAYWLNHDPSGLTKVGYEPATKLRCHTLV